jgi:cytochrome c peroxidase
MSNDMQGVRFRSLLGRVGLICALAGLTGCSAEVSADENLDAEDVGTTTAALTVDGLNEAYTLFKQNFTATAQDRFHRIGFSATDALSTETLTPAPGANGVRGVATLQMEDQRVIASIVGLAAGPEFDLWFMKNMPGPGKSVKPETGDQFFKVGTFKDSGLLQKSLNVVIGTNIRFDLDALVVTRKGLHPTASVIFTGARTLFEKRFFRELHGQASPAVSGTFGAVETLDPLVQRGAHVFFNETFAGNGRTCGTCHRAENNLTIDPAFIATLPQSDPLFVAENNPNLAQLERPAMMRQFGVILENVDGFEDLDNKFVLRSVNHTFAMSTTMLPDNGFLATDQPPDQRTGWGGDGAPGRGTLQEFTLGALVQHFPKRLNRVTGTDFRLPTQEESDALEAFQLFTGRQSSPQTLSLTFKESRANLGRDAFNGNGKCSTCHRDVVGQNNAPNFDLDTGIEAFTERVNLFPRDGGQGKLPQPNRPGAFGTGKFNVPPLIEAADTAPLFHNHTQSDLEDAITFYQTPFFGDSPGARQFSGPITMSDDDVINISAFLRIINAGENIRQVRRRLEFLRANSGPGDSALFTMAIADTQDAYDVLQARQNTFNPGARHYLATAKQTIIMAQAQPVSSRAAYIDWAILNLNGARSDLFTQNPLNLF